MRMDININRQFTAEEGKLIKQQIEEKVKPVHVSIDIDETRGYDSIGFIFDNKKWIVDDLVKELHALGWIYD